MKLKMTPKKAKTWNGWLDAGPFRLDGKWECDWVAAKIRAFYGKIPKVTWEYWSMTREVVFTIRRSEVPHIDWLFPGTVLQKVGNGVFQLRFPEGWRDQREPFLTVPLKKQLTTGEAQ